MTYFIKKQNLEFMKPIRANYLTITYMADPNMHSNEDHKGMFPKIEKHRLFHKDNWIDAFEFALECSYLVTPSSQIAHLLPPSGKRLIQHFFPKERGKFLNKRNVKFKKELLNVYKNRKSSTES